MHDSQLLSQARAREIFDAIEQAARAAGVGEVEALIGAHASALTRFANNAIHQNVSEHAHYVSVRAIVDHRTARATTNLLDPDSLESVVQRAIAMARSATPDPELLPLAEQAPIPAVDRFDPSAAHCTPAERAAAVAEAIKIVESASQTAAGIFATGHSVEALANSRGLWAYYADSHAQFSITAMAATAPVGPKRAHPPAPTSTRSRLPPAPPPRPGSPQALARSRPAATP